MSEPLTLPGLPLLSRRRALAVLVLFGAILALAAILALNIARQIEVLGASSIDNVQWTLSQMDVELLTLQVVVDDARDDASLLPEVRKRFDIAYSRFKTLQAGVLFNGLRQSHGFGTAISALNGFMEGTVPLIDGPDAALLVALPQMKDELRRLIPEAHRLGTVGVEVFAGQADSTRRAIKTALVGLALLSTALFLALLGVVLHLVRTVRRARARAQEAAATASRLDAVIGAALDPVVTLDEAGRILDFNPAGTRIFGHAPAAVEGQPVALLIPPETDGTAQLVLDPPPQRQRVTARRADGREFPAEISVSPVSSGGRRLYVLFLADLSTQLAAEQALVRARDAALAGEKAKADLLMVMSHEIRTPLNGMIGTIDLMQATKLTAEQAEYLRIMADSGRLLMRHVNDTLDLARLDSGMAGLVAEPVDLVALIGEVIENQSPSSAAQGNRLSLTLAPGLATKVIADGGRLKQVLLNLVGNAVKFTRDGRIDVTLARDDQGRHVITVADTGIGIPPADLDRIFEDFVTLDPSFARNATGTGLGLGIVRRIVAQMGGQIAVDSTPGQGSRFRLTLPLPLALAGAQGVAPAAPAPMPMPVLRPRDVLVIEDNEFNRLIVCQMLRQTGHRCVSAPDGEAGLRLAEGQHFDLILLDISMPGLDGLAVTGRLRQGGGPNAATPILALTAHAMPDDIARFRAAGMKDVLFKPLQIATLQRALADHTPPDLPLVSTETRNQMAASLPADVVARMTAKFLADTAERLSRLKGASPEVLREELHHMAGSCGVFGAVAMRAALEAALARLALFPRAAAADLPGLAALWALTAEAYLPASSRDQASSLR